MSVGNSEPCQDGGPRRAFPEVAIASAHLVYDENTEFSVTADSRTQLETRLPRRNRNLSVWLLNI